MKKKFYLMMIAIAMIVVGAGLFGSPAKASAAVKWQNGIGKSLRGDYQTKVVNHHLHHIELAKNFVLKEYRKANLSKTRNGKFEILLMWRVPSRKLSKSLYEIKSVNESGKHVHYYIRTYSHHRIRFSKNQSFAHKPYYQKSNNW